MTITLPVSPADRVTRVLRSVREVAVLWREVTRVAFPAMSRHVAELTTAGLLDRELSADDARTHVVRLTPAGRAALEKARTDVHDRLLPALQGWDDAELTELERQLARLTTDLAAATGRAPERTR